MKIIKRDGREVPFDYTKIKAAVEAANSEVEEKITDTTIGFITGKVEQRCTALARPVHVEEVQDMVLDELDKAEAYKLARHYSEYRLLHEQKRRMNTTDGELAAKCTAKRMVPDYISAKVMKKLKGDVYPCMGCRSFLTSSDNHKYYGRFNQGVVTLNLVDVACSSDGDEEKFWQLLEERCDLCFKALMCRHDRLKGTPSDVAPILWQYGALARLGKGETIDKLLYNNYSTISLGYAGIAEMTYRMKNCYHTEPDGKEFAITVMKFLNERCAEWKSKTNISFSLYGSPMESVTYKFAQCLQRRHGIIPHVTDKNYISNSYHIHVTEPIDAFSKLTFESEFQELSPGGAISLR